MIKQTPPAFFSAASSLVLSRAGKALIHFTHSSAKALSAMLAGFKGHHHPIQSNSIVTPRASCASTMKREQPNRKFSRTRGVVHTTHRDPACRRMTRSRRRRLPGGRFDFFFVFLFFGRRRWSPVTW